MLVDDIKKDLPVSELLVSVCDHSIEYIIVDGILYYNSEYEAKNT